MPHPMTKLSLLSEQISARYFRFGFGGLPSMIFTRRIVYPFALRSSIHKR